MFLEASLYRIELSLQHTELVYIEMETPDVLDFRATSLTRFVEIQYFKIFLRKRHLF